MESSSHFVEALLGIGPHLDSLFAQADLHDGVADECFAQVVVLLRLKALNVFPG